MTIAGTSNLVIISQYFKQKINNKFEVFIFMLNLNYNNCNNINF
jgi:hypothetical protein